MEEDLNLGGNRLTYLTSICKWMVSVSKIKLPMLNSS